MTYSITKHTILQGAEANFFGDKGNFLQFVKVHLSKSEKRGYSLPRRRSNLQTYFLMGFNVNEDDNHINAFLYDYMKCGKKLVIITDDERFHVAGKLKCSESEVSVCRVACGCNEAVGKTIFEEIMNDSV